MEEFVINVGNDGNGIYINNLLVDDFDRLPQYYKGYDYWYMETQKYGFDLFKRHDFICKRLDELRFRNKNKRKYL